ncbi:glucan endo-1,3-beta-glucosidase [Solanum lycopersicum]|uniref:glucan endo-1,3-beta-D-glucosidase n=1 Tax=Solanum lycopersicum TaxID=4081 RepID=A0A3Q7GQ07_SOLLC|nr:glucan endo-1,3-beta-glucosidase [Solanum lycopersicum]
MEVSNKKITSPLFTFLFISSIFIQFFPYVSCIGVNYGTLGNNLPPPSQVAQFLKDKTIIDKIKIFDVNPDILKAFANTNISVTVTVPNSEIPKLQDIGYAKSYVEANIKPFYPQTKIDVIAVGNEILHWETPEVQNKLVGAMRTLYQALTQSGINTVKVSTPHSLGILLSSNPPSLAKFRPGWDVGILAPMLQFLRETKGPFMVNPYPYFGYNPEQVDFLLFKQNKGVFDNFSKRTYTNMFDMLLDAVFMSMKRLGYDDVDIVAAETGWPSFGESFEPQCTVENAAAYNGGLVRKIVGGVGTPLMPNRKIDTYIFGLFNENTKPGSNAERNFGLFRPDFTPVYNVGIMKGQQVLPFPQPPKPLPQPQPQPQPQPRGPIPVAKPGPKVPVQPAPRLPSHPGPKHSARPGPKLPAQPAPRLPAQPGPVLPGPKPVGPMGKKFCMPKPQATDAQLQASLDWACTNQGVDCGPVQAGGPCFDPNTVRSHAAYVMNAYYQIKGKNDINCDFSGSAAIVFADPSYGTCKYLS